MAFTASKLARTISESAGAGYYDNTTPHEFIGESMSAVTAEFQFGLMSEAAEFMDLAAASDDLLAEAAMDHPEQFDVLQENVLTSIKNGILKFWKKIKEFVKGLIEKLKAAFYRLTGKTDKWLGIMKSKINDAARRTGSGDFKYTMYPFEEKYIIDELSGNLEGLMTSWDKHVGNEITEAESVSDAIARIGREIAQGKTPTPRQMGGVDRDVAKEAKETKDTVDKYARDNFSYANADDAQKDEPRITAYVEDLEKKTEKINDETEDLMDKLPGEIGGFFGINGATTMENLWTEVKEKGHGSSEKSEQQIGNRTNSMISAIEGSKKTIDKIKKAYEGHLRVLTKYESQLEKVGPNIKFTDESKNHIPSAVTRAMNDNFKAAYTRIMKVTQAYEGAMNSARQINISLVEEMTSSYMSALTAFCGYKEPKKEK